MKEKKKIDYIVFVSVIAAFSVLVLHTNKCFWEFSATEKYWVSANIIECIFYPGVPLFFMISGITLMDFYERYSLKEFFIKRWHKAVVPFIAWSLIIMLGKVLSHKIPREQLSPHFIYQSVTGTTIVDYYWFFSSLFVLYLSMPLYAAVEKEKRRLVFTYLVGAGFALNSLAPFITGVFQLDINTPYAVTSVMGVLIWVPIGWLLHDTELSKTQKFTIYGLAIAGLLLHIIGTYVLSMRIGMIDGTFKGYENVPSVLYSAGAFVLLKDIGKKVMDSRGRDFVLFLGGYTYPVYLMQFIFIKTIPLLPFVDTRSLLYRLGAPFVIVPMIIAVAACMRKIPVVRRIVP
ncbi:Surface polysaccharide O-acyltransferase, integral membrane enzyme [Butyrivibrio proteoclasticus]|uniref:Surface polysaccharide O-acyltransferase, integral membrane enzyme n=1 Tax=Butyrivibrio proteoclasticus TaxID=43305 RepID=A0A1I5UW86_9FIRM|nr:acyltransferase [Butyrivibrio proteoclasticus]SFP99478.1 Surface polysaccharide O-acyltransferase, integral membrane enzyme [Butyrivibrio proteoclasticus]